MEYGTVGFRKCGLVVVLETVFVVLMNVFIFVSFASQREAGSFQKA